MLYRLVQQGWRDPFNKTPRLTMPPLKGQLSREQTIAVIDYLDLDRSSAEALGLLEQAAISLPTRPSHPVRDR